MKQLNDLVIQMDGNGTTYREGLRQFKRAFLSQVLTRNRGNQSKAATELRMHRNTLSCVMNDLNIRLIDVRRRPPQSVSRFVNIYAERK